MLGENNRPVSCLRDDVLRWEDAEGKVFQRLIMANKCAMRITAAWCMGGVDGDVKACVDNAVIPPNGTYKSEKYAAAEMNGTYKVSRFGSINPANDLQCLTATHREDAKDFTKWVSTASSMKNQGQQGGGTSVTNVNVESGTGVKGAVGRGVGNVIENVTEGAIWDMLSN